MGNKKSQPPVQAGGTGKAGELAAVVGDLHSSVDLWAMADEFRQSIAERFAKGGCSFDACKRK